MVTSAHFQCRILAHLLARLGQLRLAGEHESGHHQRLRTRAALGKAASDEQLIETLLGSHFGRV
jgi:hypothetical protein